MIGYQCSPSAVRAPVTTSTAASSVSGGYHSSASSPTSSVASSSSSVSSSSSSSGSSASRSPISANLLDYFPEINQDGLGLSWFHQANNRSRLGEALMTNKMIVAGDISLAEMSRYPVPIMARPPLGVSDITLENWLQEMASSAGQKGIKLTFTSTRTVEPAFRVLARHAESLKGPLILDADILSRPEVGGRPPKGSVQAGSGQQQPVDAWTFLMLCRTRFPNSTISIGWCAAGDEQQVPLEECAQSNASLHSADSMFDLNIIASQHVNLHNNHLQQQHHQHHLQHQLNSHLSNLHSGHLSHHILSSTGSLHSSSSGNSSGSPSPTSPISHLQSHHHHSGGPHQMAAAAAAAAMAAAVAAAATSTFQEMPLNLNINEAALETASSTTSGAGSAHKFGLGEPSAIISQLQLHSAAAAAAHIHKKAAICSAANSNAPSPQSSTGSQRRQSITTSTTPTATTTTAAAAAAANTTNTANHLHHQHLQLGGLLKTTTNTTSNHIQLPSGANTSAASANSLPGYTREMIDKMASLVKEYNLTQPVTFPVQARLLKNSLAELQRLLYQVGPNSTLTVVVKQSDLISVDELISIRKAFATNQILFDLPDDLAASLKQELNLF